MNTKKINLAICFIAIFAQAGAQEPGIQLTGGLQGMRYKLQNGQTKALPGGSLEVSCAFRVSDGWDLLTGIAAGVYRTQATLKDGTVFTYNQVDDAGSAFQYQAKFTGYKETQQLVAANIPLLLQFHTTGSAIEWYVDAGGKVLLPITNSEQVSARQLNLSAYYPNYHVVVSNLPRHGFGTVNNWKGSASSKFKPAAALSAATGAGFRLSSGASLYTGVYVDYGLTDIRAGKGSMPLVTYSPAGLNEARANSLLNTQYAGPVTLLAFGLQVRIGFGGARAKPATPMPVAPVTPDARISIVVRTKPDAEVQDIPRQKAEVQATPLYRPATVVARRDTAQAKEVAQPEAVAQAKPAPKPDTVAAAVDTVQATPASRADTAATALTDTVATALTDTAAAAPDSTQEKPAEDPRKVMVQFGTTVISEWDAAVIQQPVEFKSFAQTDIPDWQRSNLNEVADLLKRYPKLRISIAGHHCNCGMETEKAKTGIARARAVADYLHNKGVDRSRMVVSHSSESDPVPTYDPDAYSRSRRVTITIQ